MMTTTTRTATAGGPRSLMDREGQMTQELARVDQEVRAFVKERPVLALIGAIAAGYLLGRVLRGRG